MATKASTPDTAPKAAELGQAPALLEIEALRRKHKIGPAVFAGVCEANGWRPGKQVSEEGFLQEVAAFVGAPMDGRAPRERAGK